MREWFATDPKRGEKFSLEVSGLYLDFSKNIFTEETLSLLVGLAEQRLLSEKIEGLFNGVPLNTSEDLPALHVALRDIESPTNAIRSVWQRLQLLASQLQAGVYAGYSGKPIRDVVNIGVGGSHLGPLMTGYALKPYANSLLHFHFISNQDQTAGLETLQNLNPETTLVIITSKSFTTKETMDNADRAKRWLLSAAYDELAIRPQLIAVTADVGRACAYGIREDNIFPMWEWVGGRFSIWSAVGVSLILSIGWDHFYEFLRGAHSMDCHYRQADLSQNMPVILALLSLWYVNFFNAQTHAIIPYSQRLLHLPEYLKQLHMESQGKCVQNDGAAIDYATGPVVWGGIGTDSQHSFHQLFLQGTVQVPIDFILPLKNHPNDSCQLAQMANCLGQSETLLLGYYEERAPHKIIRGNNPSNTLLMDALTPYQLGALLALYEHKVFTQCALWNINPFDQWGVERGKKCSSEILLGLQQGLLPASADSSTQTLMKRVLKSETVKERVKL